VEEQPEADVTMTRQNVSPQENNDPKIFSPRVQFSGLVDLKSELGSSRVVSKSVKTDQLGAIK